MKFTLDKKESYAIFSVLDGKLNSLVAPELKSELSILNNKGIKNVILDLGEVTFVDSSGLSAILVGNRLCSQSGGTLVLCNIADNVDRLIRISQLDSVLDIKPDVQNARDYLMLQELVSELNNGREEEDVNETEEE